MRLHQLLGEAPQDAPAWRTRLSYHRRQVAYASRANWLEILDLGLEDLQVASAPLEAALSLVDAADGWTVQTGRKVGLVARVRRAWRGAA